MKATLIPVPFLKILTGPWHSESAGLDFPVQTGSGQNSEVSKVSVIKPHPNGTLR